MKVTVCFIGICTHVVDLPVQPIGDDTVVRVVQVNASLGMFLANQHVPPHTAMLHIDPRFIASAPPSVHGLTPAEPKFQTSSWILHGAQLEIANSIGPLQFLPNYHLLPSLTTTAQRQLDLSPRTVHLGAAAGVFRVTSGDLDAFRQEDSDAVLATLTVETEGPALLAVTRMWNQRQSTIVLQNATIDGKEYHPVIAVSNTGTESDKTVDFLLHYGVTTHTPDRILLPTIDLVPLATPEQEAILKLVPDFPDGVTHGCSNSIYP